MRVLIVGAGCVGQLYGFCLQRGEAEVHVYVRQKYVARAREGYVLYNRARGLRDPQRFEPARIHSSPESVAAEDFDAVILSIPSDGLRGPWFDEFAAALGDATVVSLTPALADREFVLERVGSERLVTGLITSVSYPAPLPGEEVAQDGTAYWFPPLAAALFEGAKERLQPLLDRLNKGGMKAKAVKNLAVRAGFASAVLIPGVATLETVDWSFKRLRKDKERLRLLTRATDETLEAVELHFGKKRPVATNLLSPMTIKGGLIMAPRVAPFDLEVYLQVHFTKVGAQTRLFFEDYIKARSAAELESPALAQLQQELSPAATTG